MSNHTTEIQAENGRQDLNITRIFELPVEQLFEAFTDPEIIQEWMSNTVLKHENRKFGSYAFEKKDESGNILFSANGVFHEFIENQKITRTFEMTNAGLEPQIEFLEFLTLGESLSQLKMQIIYRDAAHRDQMLQFGMGRGMHLAHDRLEKVVKQKSI